MAYMRDLTRINNGIGDEPVQRGSQTQASFEGRRAEEERLALPISPLPLAHSHTSPQKKSMTPKRKPRSRRRSKQIRKLAPRNSRARRPSATGSPFPARASPHRPPPPLPPRPLRSRRRVWQGRTSRRRGCRSGWQAGARRIPRRCLAIRVRVSLFPNSFLKDAADGVLLCSTETRGGVLGGADAERRRRERVIHADFPQV